ncbi:hypothetical protein J7J58_06840 [candidate division WOR-3 bacterium]|nr:hypothetical protein [candidate division WOR-3 bacterium]
MKRAILFLMLVLPLWAFGEKIAILDYNPTTIDENARKSFISLFIDDLSGKYNYSVSTVSDSMLPNYWGDKDKITDKFRNGEYTKVVIFKYYYINETLIIRMDVLDLLSKKFVINENLNLSDPDEIEYAAKAAATVLGERKSLSELVKNGILVSNNVTARKVRRSKGENSFGISTGYMWNTLTYDHLYAGHYKKVLMLNCSFITETTDNSRVSINLDWPVAAGIAASIGYSYITHPGVNTAYFGFDFGAEYDYARKDINPNSSIGGVLLRPKIGFVMLNSYYTSVYIEGAGRFVTTDFLDSGLEIRAGILFRGGGN